MHIIPRLSFILLLVGFLLGNPTPMKKGYGPGDQEWGHIDVRSGAHMFYWLFYVQDPEVTSYHDRPLVVWLQGGPGGSSSGFGNFEEIGPLFLNGTARPTSWAKHVNLLFVDNPVGAGFSYVSNLSRLTKTNAQIGRDMVSFLKSFYSKHPKFEKTPFYIFSESYGGKMAVEIARQLLKAIQSHQIKMNFKGVGLADSWISPRDTVNSWAPFLFNMGLVDANGVKRLTADANAIQKAMEAGRYEEATKLWVTIVADVFRETGNVDFYNVLTKVKTHYDVNKNQLREQDIAPRFDTEQLQKLMEGPVKKALGISPKIVHNGQSGAVFQALAKDFMKPTINVVEELLNKTNLQIAVITGNLDLIVASPGTVTWVDKMHWVGANQWKSAVRKPLSLKGYLEGYVKNFGNLYLYWVTRSGHMVPMDNAETALEILRRVTNFDKTMKDVSEEESPN